MSDQIKESWKIDRLLREHGFVIYRRAPNSEPVWIWTENNLYHPKPLSCQMFLQSEALALVVDSKDREEAFVPLRK